MAYLILNAVSYEGEILHTDPTRDDHAGYVLGFMSIGVVVKKMMTFSKNVYTFAAVWCLYQLAGWLEGGPLQ